MAIFAKGSDGKRHLVAGSGGQGLFCPYRIGDILETENPTPPGESWPGTQWEELTGRFLLGRTPPTVGEDGAETDPGRLVGTVGGEETHTLTVQEMPSHDHGEFIDNGGIKTAYTLAGGTGAPTSGHFIESSIAYTGNRLTTEFSGGSQPHNNMPPYRVVHIWKRTG